ncbi:hypothetical protein SAMN04488245_102285 [Alloyangia pacifica]|uniref:Uncharacterized protein n=2 Tax=Alloyangia pacifica TaxID=311180 RepID=A0A1I6PJT3_9RHOB|nr:hypothetical protein SAMN04488245_102285 [Alloyangia pacifica]SFS40410.1 hypothetical protein SAMN04488050_101586 [Alloyangia pacifica]
MTALLLACVLTISLGAGVFAIFGGPGGETAAGVVLVIAPPWGLGAPALVIEAGGRQIGPASAPFGTFATFEGPAPVARLRALGAWATRDARALATICGVRP